MADKRYKRKSVGVGSARKKAKAAADRIARHHTNAEHRVSGGPSNLILHGKTYHRILPGQYESGPLRFFLYDGLSDKGEKRLEGEWVRTIREELSRVSPFWNKLKSLSEQTAKFARSELTVTRAREIAALIVTDPNKPIKAKTIVYWRQTKKEPVFVSSKSALYFPLQYALIVPDGMHGWSEEMKDKISQLAYYRHLLMRHKSMHMLGPLLNEFVVDIFSAVETDRLDYLRKQQKRVVEKDDLSKLRSDETTSADGEVKIGRVYLTSEFLGSPRHQQKLVADALAIVKRYAQMIPASTT
ncbi:hypothetical protein RvY_01678 [Ramazzottius varieornatus]|uniref:Helitron helicase-like domain-containing protein n=1 Tax=Ramazzottius varieornatus TaxID=947166 RepID=A0A1D1URU6_RAMVA|nr:hypothetical protein RvY_01678 [Ramazzottius varieornatus]